MKNYSKEGGINMKHIKNRRAFATGVITAVGAFICFGAIIIQGLQTRFLISLLILVAWSVVSWFSAFTQKGVAEKVSQYADERDRYIVQRSSHAALLINNYLLFGGCFLAIILYGILKNTVFLTVAATLCGVLIAMLIVLICANIWFEKHD